MQIDTTPDGLVGEELFQSRVGPSPELLGALLRELGHSIEESRDVPGAQVTDRSRLKLADHPAADKGDANRFAGWGHVLKISVKRVEGPTLWNVSGVLQSSSPESTARGENAVAGGALADQVRPCQSIVGSARDRPRTGPRALSTGPVTATASHHRGEPERRRVTRRKSSRDPLPKRLVFGTAGFSANSMLGSEVREIGRDSRPPFCGRQKRRI